MPGEARGRSRWTFSGQPGLALVAASVLLPMALFALAAWYSYRETLQTAEGRVERTARILEEHALKVFETHRLVIDEVNLRLRFMDWSHEADRADLHRMLVRLQDDLDQVSTITVIDAQGHMIASGRTYPADPSKSFADRDYFEALRRAGSTLPFVSMSYVGRQSKQAVFNLAGRIDPGPSGRFAGVIAVSADRSYFERFYQAIEPTLDRRVLLVRADGAILASEPPLPFETLPPDSVLRQKMRTLEAGGYTLVSRLDGVERISAFRKVGRYPVFVRFGISKAAALAPWRSTLVDFGIVAALAALALLAVSALAVRQTSRERLARHRWQETAAALQAAAAERERIEGQLRQAQKMEAVGRLTGGLAHDFNNLLTAVIGSLDLVRRRPAGIDERNLRFIANALEGAHRAAALTSRLLAFSRQSPLEPVAVDVHVLVTGMSDLLRRTLGETVEIETVLEADLWPVMVDPNGLESAIVNLAVNARDAMPGGGRIVIAASNARCIDQPEIAPGDYVTLSVKDDGTGMPPEVVAQIFEPFFTTKPVGRGTGLGLSQVYGFAKQSGGHISVVSAPGDGSTFRLLLPRAAAQMPAMEAMPAAPDVRPLAGTASGETILVVEDDEMVRGLSVAALEDAGYRVVSAPDAATALDLVEKRGEIALLFTDVVLTGSMDGRALAEDIAGLRPGLPVLFTTGYSRNALVHDGRLDEGIELIGKPFTGGELVARVRDLLGQRRGTRFARLVRRRA